MFWLNERCDTFPGKPGPGTSRLLTFKYEIIIKKSISIRCKKFACIIFQVKTLSPNKLTKLPPYIRSFKITLKHSQKFQYFLFKILFDFSLDLRV